MVRFTDDNLKLISDIGKYEFIEITIKGDISVIYEGYVKANNKSLKSYDANNLLYISYA